MVRPSGWEILGLDQDPTPGMVESVEALAKEFGDFAHDVQAAHRGLSSFGSDTGTLQWIGQTADAFKATFGPLPGRLQKLYISYSEASDALSAYALKLVAAQHKADAALRQAVDAHAELQRATTTADNAAADLKTAQQRQAVAPNPQAVTDAQGTHDAAQRNLTAAKDKLDALSAQAKQALEDRVAAAKECAKELHHAQSDGIHNKHWWEHVGATLSEWGGKIAEVAGEIAPVLDVIALTTSWIPGVDVITAGLAEADNLVALAGTGAEIAGDTMQGHYGDALMGAGMLGATYLGGKAVEKFGGSALEKLGDRAGKDAEHGAQRAEGNAFTTRAGDPVDVVSGQMITEEIDLALPGVLPLLLRRAYASNYAPGRLFGPGWSSTLDQRVAVNEAGIHFVGDDAQMLQYPLMPTGAGPVLPVGGAPWPLTWDRESDEILIEDRRSGQVRHFPIVHYRDELGQIRDLTAVTDRNGNRIEIVRSGDGTPIAVEHSGGYRVNIQTAATSSGIRITGLGLRSHDSALPDTRLVVYGYDAQGRLSDVTNSSAVPYVYEYDSADRITAWTDRVGYRYAYEYDAIGRVVSAYGVDGSMVATFDYDRESQVTRVSDSLGVTTEYHYDADYHVAKVVDPLGAVTLIQSDMWGRVLTRVDALGRSTAYTYDSDGNLREVVRPDGAVVLAEYGHLGKPVMTTDPAGAVRRYSYDPAGNLTEAVDPFAATTSFAYDSVGAPIAVTDATGTTIRVLVNDAAGLATSVTGPTGTVVRMERDAFGRVVRVVDTQGGEIRWGWTVEGRPAWRVARDGSREEWEYDAQGNLIGHRDRGRLTRFERGAFGKVTARIDPDGTRYCFSYDTELRLQQVANPLGLTWSYEHDARGRITAETDFSGRSMHYEYDLAGQLVRRIDGAGTSVEFERDALGLVITENSSDGRTTFAYDALGNLAQALGPDGKVLELERDLLGRVVAESFDGLRISYSYDQIGRRVRRQTPNGHVSEWAYRSDGTPQELAVADDRIEFAYEAGLRESLRRVGDVAVLAFTHDDAGRLASQDLRTADGSLDTNEAEGAHHTVQRRAYSYDAYGQISVLEDSDAGTRRFTRDMQGRVGAIDGETWSEQYFYDSAGRLTGSALGVGPSSAADEIAEAGHGYVGNRLVRAKRDLFDYDAQGRLVRRTRRTLSGKRKVWSYVWDSRGRLVEIAAPDESRWYYSYDPVGRRVAKKQVAIDGRTLQNHRFSWDGPRLAEEIHHDADGGVTAVSWDYIPGTWNLVSQSTRSWDAAKPQTVDERFDAIITDLSGAPTEMVSADGRISWRRRASLWGETVGASGEVDCRLRFPGQYHDPETGLHYNYQRYYDPETARYVSSDPLGLAPNPDDYAYPSDPWREADPLGLCPSPAAPQDMITVYRYGDRNNPYELSPKITMAPPDVQAEIMHNMQDPVWAEQRAHLHMRGDTEHTPYISVAYDYHAAAASTDPWLHNISRSTPDLATFHVPADRLVGPRPTNDLSIEETEVLFNGTDLSHYLVGWGPNPYRGLS